VRIALFGPGHPFRGGIAFFTHRLAHELELERPGASIWAPFERQYPSFLFPGASDREPEGGLAELRPGDLHWNPWSPTSTREVAAEVARRGAEVAVIPWWTWFWAPFDRALLAALRRAGIERFLAVVHNVSDHESSRWKEIAAAMVLDRADGFLTHSTEMASRLERLFPGRPVGVTPLPLHPLPGERRLERREARARLGLPPDGPVFLFFGLIRPYKGLDVLLDAWSEIRRRTGATLVVAGEPWSGEAGALARRAEALDGVVSRLGYVPDAEVAPYFRAADLVVLPYRSVTGSGVVPIAAWFGRPVLASRLPGLIDAVEEGVDALVVPAGSSAALAASAVDFVARDLGPTLTRGMEAAAGTRFSWSHYIDILFGTIARIEGRGTAASGLP